MVGIVLTILKVIGIILLILVGILLCFIGTVLFWPIYYRFTASKEDGIQAVVNISWIFRILRFRGWYEQGKEFEYYFKVLFFQLYPKKEKNNKKKKNVSKKKESLSENDDTKEDALKKDATEKEEIEKDEFERKETEKEEILQEGTIEESLETQVDVEEKSQGNREEQKKRKQRKGKDSSESKKEAERQNIFYKIKDKIKHIKFTFQKFCNKVKELLGNYEKFKEFVTSEETRETLKFLNRQRKYLARHLKPDKFQVNIHYGMDDPAHTGEILAAYSVMYPFLPGKWNIIPDFENACIDGNINMKGKVRLYTILIVLWRCYKNETINKFIPIGK